MVKGLIDALTAIDASKYLQKTFGYIIGIFVMSFVAMVWFMPYLVLLLTVFLLTHK